MKDLFGITWGATQNIYVFLSVIVVLSVLLHKKRKSERARRALTGSWLQKLIPSFSSQRELTKIGLFTIGVFFLCLSLLHPLWNKKPEVITQEGRDVFIALDISRSMLAVDCVPNRLECAKKKIKNLVKNLACERVGLILFSGAAFVQCPLTSDTRAFNMFLDQVDVETISSGTTALDKALKKVLDAYKGLPDKKNKLVVLVTDGEDFSSNLRRFKDKLAQERVRLFALGVGTSEGAPIPLSDEDGKIVGHQEDHLGNIVISRLNEDMLKSLAHDSGGSYVHLTQGNDDINHIVNQVQRFEKDQMDDRSFSRLQEQYPYFLAVSFACFILEWLL